MRKIHPNGIWRNLQIALQVREPASGNKEMNGAKLKWYLNPVIVILLLFFVLGPFGLPLLYKSPRFGKTSRIILTILVTLYTLGMILGSLELGRELYIRMKDYQSILQEM
jgi:hypothetical protein